MLTLVDAHVHVYAGADVPALLDAATAHFSAAASRNGASAWRGVLLLTETAGDAWFESAAAAHGGCEFGGWRIAGRADDPLSLLAQRDADRVWLVAGRQIVTAERLEVHALGTRERLRDGRSLDDTLADVRRAGALPILPWGVGKWLGGRGRLVRTRLAADPALGVSDNGGRPWFWRDALLVESQRSGRLVLRGSDPLPIPGEERRAGSYGCGLTGLPPETFAARALLDRLAGAAPELRPYGRPETLARFLRNQVGLRVQR